MPPWNLTVFLLICSISFSWEDEATRIVTTKEGKLQGKIREFRDDGAVRDQLVGNKVEMFLGVPFAAPPVGSLRFLPPVTSSPWRNVKKAVKFGPVCPQRFPDVKNRTKALLHMSEVQYKDILKIQGELVNESEDCLYLNVYSPVRGKFPTDVEFLPLLLIFFFVQR